MRLVWKLAILPLSIFVLFCGLLIGMSRLEVPTRSYDSYQDGLGKELFGGGWVPTWLPKSAINIQEAHDIDTNEVWLSFQFSNAEDFQSTPCQPTTKSAVVLPREKRWILVPNLVLEIHDAVTTDPSLEFFDCGSSPYIYLAVNNQTKMAYIWIHYYL